MIKTFCHLFGDLGPEKAVEFCWKTICAWSFSRLEVFKCIILPSYDVRFSSDKGDIFSWIKKTESLNISGFKFLGLKSDL